MMPTPPTTMGTSWPGGRRSSSSATPSVPTAPFPVSLVGSSPSWSGSISLTADSIPSPKWWRWAPTPAVSPWPRVGGFSPTGVRARELEEEQEIFAEQSVRYERARIARELHDIVAHSVSLMVVQANAGERMATRRSRQRRRSIRVHQRSGPTGRNGNRPTGRTARATLVPASLVARTADRRGAGGSGPGIGPAPSPASSVGTSTTVRERRRRRLPDGAGEHHQCHEARPRGGHRSGDPGRQTAGSRSRSPTARPARARQVWNGPAAVTGLAGMRERVAQSGGTFRPVPTWRRMAAPGASPPPLGSVPRGPDGRGVARCLTPPRSSTPGRSPSSSSTTSAWCARGSP